MSILEDYFSDFGRTFNGLNYDTESGKLLSLSDVVTDSSGLSEAVEKSFMARIGEDEPFGETSVADYFVNTPQEDLNWTLDCNGVTFYFSAGAVAPTNFGVQIVTVTFAEYPYLFSEKYTDAPEAYTVGLPLNLPFFTDITGDKKADEITVLGDYDSEGGYYTSMAVYTEKSEYEEEWFSYGLDPYYVKTSDGNSYICVYSLNSEDESRETVLSTFSLKNGGIEFLGTSEIGPVSKGNNVFALPADPDKILL